ncbi:hypothetical protein ARALYDRAFT_328572 [Arabidopsis lyrata subsp. lyrata]|uniref:Cytochrome P450 n=1 Tax=Arabidopsis lyrata subsp. lyrata TaxID=81972 RepID=D7MB58_ARALL|nr:hypothetical protein ARALYDRAFT_328572 [Arabidopsis lyrata subsp. lyrata]
MAFFLCVLWGLLLLTFVSLIFFMTKVRETLNGIFLRAIQVSRSSETYTNFAGLPHRCFHHLSIKYGPVVLLHRGFVPMVVISSSEAAEEDLKTHDLGCCSRPRTVGTGKLSYGRHSTGPYGEHWREMGKLAVIELFSLKKVQSYRNIREEEVEFMVKIVSQSASKFE